MELFTRSSSQNQEMLGLWQESFYKAKSAVLVVKGTSMEPTLPRGSHVLVTKAYPEEIIPGDIVVFKREGELITHRVIDKFYSGERLFFAEKGDCIFRAAQIEADLVVGKVVASLSDSQFDIGKDPLARYYRFLYKVRTANRLRLPGSIRKLYWKLVFMGAGLRVRHKNQ